VKVQESCSRSHPQAWKAAGGGDSLPGTWRHGVGDRSCRHSRVSRVRVATLLTPVAARNSNDPHVNRRRRPRSTTGRVARCDSCWEPRATHLKLKQCSGSTVHI